MFIIALLAALWHLGWVLVLWNAPGAMLATPLAPYYALLGTSRAVADALFVISTLALAGKWRWPSGWKLFACLIPQQAALMLSAFSAIAAIAVGHYADGVIRPRDFIFLDQWGNIIPVILHTGYMVWLFAHSFNGGIKPSVRDE